jgi:hypothetical protein
MIKEEVVVGHKPGHSRDTGRAGSDRCAVHASMHACGHDKQIILKKFYQREKLGI